MSEFLSDTWLAEMVEAAREAPSVASLAAKSGLERLVVDQTVTDVPGRGEVRYHVIVTPASVSISPGAPDRADVAFVTDYETAVAISCGDVNAQRALATGSFRVRGSADALVAWSEVLTGLDDLFAEVRGRTTYGIAR